MNTISPQMTDAASVLGRLLGSKISSLEELHGGRNSKVYGFSAGPERLVAKFYFRHPGDARDRLDTEYSGLKFLWDNGLRSIPRPVAADKAADCAVFSRVDGRILEGREAADADIDAAVRFCDELRLLRDKPGAAKLGPASEACLKLRDVEDNLRARVKKLQTTDEAALKTFMDEDLGPLLDETIAASKKAAADAGLSWDAELPAAERTLSQSDFGFHNALRDGDGRVTFLDFEYFGWDDPAKMICDFMLQPVVGLPEKARARFRQGALSRFPSRTLPARVAFLYALFGLKWALIMLNDFVPEHRERRGFAGKTAAGAAQLEKSRGMLERVKAERAGFHA